MSRIIADLLGQPQHAVTKQVKQLEEKNGFPSHDVRHIADNIQRTRIKISELGLDPDDTTAEELYHALLVKFQRDSQKFDKLNGLSGNDFSSKAALALRVVNGSLNMPQRWVLKSSAIKNLLRQHPPKKLLKQLNYRSVDSFLKRENLSQISLAAGFLEPLSWQKDQIKLLSKVDSSQCELGSISLGYMSTAKWGGLGSGQIAYNDDVGYLALIETADSDNTPLLSMVVQIIDVLAEFEDLNLSKEIAKLSPVLAWWSDMDGLISSLGDVPVALSIKDASHNACRVNAFEHRAMEGSRSSFWRELSIRYENQLAVEEDSLLNLKEQVIKFKPLSAPQPAFEFAENF